MNISYRMYQTPSRGGEAGSGKVYIYTKHH